MTIETDLDPKYIHQAPMCPCGKKRMLSLTSDTYKYGGWD